MQAHVPADPLQFLLYGSPASDAQPEIFGVAPRDVVAFIGAPTPGPGLFVASRSDLEGLLALAGVRSAGGLIADVGVQHVTRKRSDGSGKTEIQTIDLTRTFASGGNFPRLAVRSSYTAPGRLEQGVRAFLRRNPAVWQHLFVGVTDAIFAEIARHATAPDAESAARRLLRQRYAGVSDAIESVRRDAISLARGDGRILILGPSGAGKSLLAKCMHEISGRSGPFQRINCSRIAEGVAEVELFGSVLGAFTGAVDKAGLFEAAHKGTLFLDEVALLSPAVQAKLLCVLDDGVVSRLGNTLQRKVDVRVIAATNADLLKLVDSGDFRFDLYQRLTVSTIRTPALDEHHDDFRFHVDRIWRARAGAAFQANLVKLLLKREGTDEPRRWKGNVRELKNFLDDLYVRANGRPLTREMLRERLRALDGDQDVPRPVTKPKSRPGSESALAWEVQRYMTARGVYQDLEQILRTVVERLAAELSPVAIVRSRTKSVAALAERLQRDWTDDLFRDVRDLCGLRVIFGTEAQKLDLLDLLHRYFEVESGPMPAGHDPKRDPEVAPELCWIRIPANREKELAARFGVEVPRELSRHWAEVQLQLATQAIGAAWRETTFGHLDAPAPASWARDFAEADVALARAHAVFERIRRCTTTYGGFLTREQARHELAILETTLRCVPGDVATAARAGRLALLLGELERARALMEPHAESQHGPLLRDLGVVLCQTHDKHSRTYRRGIDLLERACELSPRDPDAFASLAGAYRRAGDPTRARELYRRALRIDDAFPYAVGGLLELELLDAPGSDLVTVHQPALLRAIERCREQILATAGLPFAYLNLGKFLVLLGNLREGLEAYVEALGAVTAPFMLETSLTSLTSLCRAVCVPPSLEVARRMLAIGRCARFPSAEAAAELAASVPLVGRMLPAPVVLVVGKAGEPSVSVLAALGETLAGGLRGFTGTVASVGDVGRTSGAVAAARGVLSRSGASVVYRQSEVTAFAAAAPATLFDDVLYPTLAPWAELLAAGVKASSVLLLALGDEKRTLPDRRLAQVLGAQVAVLAVGGSPTVAAPNARAASSARGTAAAELVVRDAEELRVLIAKLQHR